MFRFCLSVTFILFTRTLSAQQVKPVTLVDVDSGWASNSVNTVIFRKNSLATYQGTQYIAFYNQQQFVVIGKRKSGDKKWQLKQTIYKGNAKDAHNCISIAVDGLGYLHMSWDHHNNQLNYCKSKSPGSLELTDKISMTGSNEQKVSYPEFHKLPGGDLLFFFRDGGSGRGNLVLNRYDVKTKSWSQLHSNLVDGEGQRNAYWQSCVDRKGVIHLSWVWRESPDVASNHDMGYARSIDGGKTWTTSTGIQYSIPITAASAEYAWKIPQKSELINQTSMCSDAFGNIFIATYWKEKGDSIPQYHLIFKNNNQWKQLNLGFRKTGFSLSGAGTKRIPVSRPQIIAWKKGPAVSVCLIFRDAERNNHVSVAICNDIAKAKWEIKDLLKEPVGSWEPAYDIDLWKEKAVLSLFIQKVEQADAEGNTNFPPQMIKVLEWKPVK